MASNPRPYPVRNGGIQFDEKAFEIRDLQLDGEGALYDQIYRALRDAILAGRVEPGTRLPTTRALARELGISRNTVVSAFEPLQAEGYVVSRVGAGTFVAPQVGSHAAMPDAHRGPEGPGTKPAEALRLSRYGRRLALQEPRRIYAADAASAALPYDFRPCVPDLERLPYEAWRRSLTRTAQHLPNADFGYASDPAGRLELREAIASYLGRARGVDCRAGEIVIVAGVAQAIDLTTRLFVDEGETVLLEDPHYLGARRAFESAGAEIVAAPVDSEGMDLESVPGSVLDACRMAYLTPSHQFPAGSVLSLSRRLEVLRWAERANAFVLEDDYDSEFRYAGRAIPSLKSLDHGDRVVYVGTFSKTLLPALRIAYVVLPPSLVELFRTAKWCSDWAAPTFEQAALTRHLTNGDFERHLRRARTLYSAGRKVLVESIDRELEEFGLEYHDSQAGLHLLVRLARVPQSRTAALVQRAREVGLGLYPAAPCYLASPPESLELVLGFGRLDPDSIRTGIQRLRELLMSDH